MLLECLSAVAVSLWVAVGLYGRCHRPRLVALRKPGTDSVFYAFEEGVTRVTTVSDANDQVIVSHPDTWAEVMIDYAYLKHDLKYVDMSDEEVMKVSLLFTRDFTRVTQ